MKQYEVFTSIFRQGSFLQPSNCKHRCPLHISMGMWKSNFPITWSIEIEIFFGKYSSRRNYKNSGGSLPIRFWTYSAYFYVQISSYNKDYYLPLEYWKCIGCGGYLLNQYSFVISLELFSFQVSESHAPIM